MRYLLIILLAAALVGCGTQPTYKVTYLLETNGADVTYRNPSGGTEQNHKPSNWTLSFNAKYGQPLYLSGQGGKNGHVSCAIIVNGRIIQTAEANGDYHIATCSGVAR